MEYEKIAKKYRKNAIVDTSLETVQQVSLKKDVIEKLLPHRHPFLFVDEITHIDFKEDTIMGKRLIDPNDPIFKGHFPDYPIYPGVLQIETIGQLALCLYSLKQIGGIDIEGKKFDLNVRFLKVNHTLFQDEVLPEDEIIIQGKFLNSDDFTCQGIGQIIKGDKICTISIGEFYIV